MLSLKSGFEVGLGVPGFVRFVLGHRVAMITSPGGLHVSAEPRLVAKGLTQTIGAQEILGQCRAMLISPRGVEKGSQNQIQCSSTWF